MRFSWRWWSTPDAGSLIPKGHGLRKLRWQSHGSGKRGGVRIIYYWSDGENMFYMLYVYQKTRQDDLTQAQLRALGKLCQEELK